MLDNTFTIFFVYSLTLLLQMWIRHSSEMQKERTSRTTRTNQTTSNVDNWGRCRKIRRNDIVFIISYSTPVVVVVFVAAEKWENCFLTITSSSIIPRGVRWWKTKIFQVLELKREWEKRFRFTRYACISVFYRREESLT